MSQAIFSVRMDEKLKTEFETLCNTFGMNMSTAINVFARAVVKERKIPFEISAEYDSTTLEALNAFYAIRKRAQENGLSSMTMEEIDEEISRARKGINE